MKFLRIHQYRNSYRIKAKILPSLLVESFVAVAVELSWTDGGGEGGGDSIDNEKNEYIS
jgi:hypothetical protein